MLIRREAPQDAEVIRAITAAAFARPGQGVPMEAPLVDWLRASPAWIAALSLVAVDAVSDPRGRDMHEGEIGGDVIGHVVCTRGHVGAVRVLALGPLSVRPDRQRGGVGSALMHAVLGAADALAEPLVALLGSTQYYPRFGFRLGSDYGITPKVPAWEPDFQVRTLTAYREDIRGPFSYPEPFDRI